MFPVFFIGTLDDHPLILNKKLFFIAQQRKVHRVEFPRNVCQGVNMQCHRHMVAVVVFGREVKVHELSTIHRLCRFGMVTAKEFLDAVRHPFDLVGSALLNGAIVCDQRIYTANEHIGVFRKRTRML